MLAKSAKTLTAPKLRAVLISTIVLLIVLCAIGFWFFRGQLMSYAQTVQADAAAASVSTKDITRLQELKQKLQDDSVAVTRAQNIVADSKSYQYQDQIIDNITAYAQDAGLHVSSFAFSTDNLPGATAGAAAQSSASTTSPGTPQAPAGLKALTTTVSIKNPANYKAVMSFIHSIELNLTKMQLTGISLSRDSSDPNMVSVNPISIEVYTK